MIDMGLHGRPRKDAVVWSSARAGEQTGGLKVSPFGRLAGRAQLSYRQAINLAQGRKRANVQGWLKGQGFVVGKDARMELKSTFKMHWRKIPLVVSTKSRTWAWRGFEAGWFERYSTEQHLDGRPASQDVQQSSPGVGLVELKVAALAGLGGGGMLQNALTETQSCSRGAAFDRRLGCNATR